MSPPAKPTPSRAAEPIAAWRVDPEAVAVELVDVSFSYDVRPVLKGITMTIPRGKIVAIMGGSGCGKTTSLRLIGGQLRPQSGQVRVGGQSVPDLGPDRPTALLAAGAAAVAGVIAYLSARFLVRYLRFGRLDPFAYYCAALGVATLIALR